MRSVAEATMTAPQPARAAARKEDVVREARAVDVLLLLEGTYPYISGGVSSWVHQIVRGFPDLSFGAVFLGSRRSDYGEPRYQMPENFVHLENHYLHDAAHDDVQPAPVAGDAQWFAAMRELHDVYRRRRGADRKLAQLLPQFADGGELDSRMFLHSKQAWDYTTQMYRERCTDPSFVDYFWTVRIMHSPIWKLAKMARRAPSARVLHTVSTGYAGFLGVLLKHAQGRPLIVSEHGIYTKERKIDLFQASWVRDNRGVFEHRTGGIAYFKDLWVRFFEALGRSAYDAARHVVSLYEANRQRQIADGADAARTRSIPNGIDLARFAPLREKRVFDADGRPAAVACLIGRVVPIKDVKTFVRAMRSVVTRLPHAQGWIAGPEDEDKEYANECRLIVESLDLRDAVKFLGFQQMTELLPQVGVVVLSSISEALPLVILEGYAAGIPCVSTDVGSCRQLIEGGSDDDRALGNSGAVVRIADPQALGNAVADLLVDPQRWHAAAGAGIARVERLYTAQMMFDRYRELYEESMAQPDEAPISAAKEAA
jgi:glycosyltransferase involved in cell wall biosynthesis